MEVGLISGSQVRRAKVFKELALVDAKEVAAVQTTQHLDAPALEALVSGRHAEIAVGVQRDPMGAMASRGELDQRLADLVAIGRSVNGIHNRLRHKLAPVPVVSLRSSLRLMVDSERFR